MKGGKLMRTCLIHIEKFNYGEKWKYLFISAVNMAKLSKKSRLI